MPVTDYTYSIDGAFPDHKVAPDRLDAEVRGSAIATLLVGVRTSGDDCFVQFADALSVGDKAILDGLVAAHCGDPLRAWVLVVVDPSPVPVVPGSSIVVANDRPAVQVEDGVTGYAAIQGIWPLAQADHAEVRATMKFILQASGTGSKVRLALKAKAQATGEDSSADFTCAGFSVVPVDFDTLGEVFEGAVTLSVPGFKLDDALAVHSGRDGANALGAGAADDVSEAVQIISMKLEAR